MDPKLSKPRVSRNCMERREPLRKLIMATFPPTIKEGGVTLREARQTAVLSFAQIRKLQIPASRQDDT